MPAPGKRQSSPPTPAQQEFSFIDDRRAEAMPAFPVAPKASPPAFNPPAIPPKTPIIEPYSSPRPGKTSGPQKRNQIQYIEVDSTHLPVTLTRHGRAKHYLLRLHPKGTVSVTVPRGGSMAQAYEFLHSRQDWVAKQWRKMREQNPQTLRWGPGSRVYFRGEDEILREDWIGSQRMIIMGEERMMGPDEDEDWRPYVESYMRFLAGLEFPTRTRELAGSVGLSVNRVTVRNQRSRWGSCSSRSNIALNWRLIQAPQSVLDYVIYHELAHIVEMNHSSRFWNLVRKFCPDYEILRTWLKQNARLLGM